MAHAVARHGAHSRAIRSHIHALVGAGVAVELDGLLVSVAAVSCRMQPCLGRLAGMFGALRIVSYHRTRSEGQESAVKDEERVESIAVVIGRWPEEVDRLGNSHRFGEDIDMDNPVEDTVDSYAAAAASRGHWAVPASSEDRAERSQPFEGL